jgi:hypothetical protein
VEEHMPVMPLHQQPGNMTKERRTLSPMQVDPDPHPCASHPSQTFSGAKPGTSTSLVTEHAARSNRAAAPVVDTGQHLTTPLLQLCIYPTHSTERRGLHLGGRRPEARLGGRELDCSRRCPVHLVGT